MPGAPDVKYFKTKSLGEASQVILAGRMSGKRLMPQKGVNHYFEFLGIIGRNFRAIG